MRNKRGELILKIIIKKIGRFPFPNELIDEILIFEKFQTLIDIRRKINFQIHLLEEDINEYYAKQSVIKKKDLENNVVYEPLFGRERNIFLANKDEKIELLLTKYIIEENIKGEVIIILYDPFMQEETIKKYCYSEELVKEKLLILNYSSFEVISIITNRKENIKEDKMIRCYVNDEELINFKIQIEKQIEKI